jgi:hypothetical protein
MKGQELYQRVENKLIECFDDVALLGAIVLVVLKKHRPDYQGEMCIADGFDYPCDTVKVIMDLLKMEVEEDE